MQSSAGSGVHESGDEVTVDFVDPRADAADLGLQGDARDAGPAVPETPVYGTEMAPRPYVVPFLGSPSVARNTGAEGAVLSTVTTTAEDGRMVVLPAPSVARTRRL